MSKSQPPSGANGGDLKRTESYQWPTGHEAHITSGQQAALDRFKTLCQEKGYYTPASADQKTRASHDDETMLRYLRARKFVPQDAFGQFKDTEDWRKENKIDALYQTIDIDEYDQTRRLYPQWTGRRDKRGIPFYVFEVNAIDTKSIAAQDKSKDGAKKPVNSKVPPRLLRLFALYENLCRFVLPLCSAIPDRQHKETPISQSSNLVDISKVGLTKFWSLKNHMGDASTLASAHYPETLDRIFVVGAPSFFPTVWQWVQKWFDPITVSKIFILSDKEMGPTLAKFIDMDNVPKKYGGNLDWKFGDLPFLEPAIADALSWKEAVKENGHRTLPKGPIKWQYAENGNLTATAIGTQNGVARNQVIATLQPKEGVAKLALSPGRTTSALAVPLAPSAAASTQAPVVATGEPVAVKVPEENAGPKRDAISSDATHTGNYTVPYVDRENEIASPPVESRHGTSATKLEQQQHTHAKGVLEAQSPETRVDGQGEKTYVMEPNTVGQAPKEHPMKAPEEHQPTIMEQAQAAAGQAQTLAVQGVTTVMGAVGLGGTKEQAPEPEEAPPKKEDPAISAMEPAKVEEYLRHQNLSSTRPSGQ
nr:sec14 cytosolic factor [Quercus suber]